MESPAVATRITTERRTEKKNGFKKRFGVATIVIFGKLWKTIKIKQVCEKPDFRSGSRLRVGKVLAPYSARPRAVPLIKKAQSMWFSKCYFFPKNNKTKMLKETKCFFKFFGPDKD